MAPFVTTHLPLGATCVFGGPGLAYEDMTTSPNRHTGVVKVDSDVSAVSLLGSL